MRGIKKFPFGCHHILSIGCTRYLFKEAPLMNKKFWLAAILVGLSGGFVSCSDDAGKEGEAEEHQLSYSLVCVSPSTCALEIPANAKGLVTVQLKSSTQDGVENVVSDAVVVASSSSTLFTMQDVTESTLNLKTDASGMVAVLIGAGSEPGVGTIVFSTSESNVASPLTFTITVKEEKQEDPIVEPDEPTKASYNVRMRYAGAQDLVVADAYLVPGRTCSEIAPSGLSAAEIKAIPVGEYGKVAIVDEGGIGAVSIDIEIEEREETVYAAVARAKASSAYSAYGCKDNVGGSVTSVVVDLDDAFVDPDNPDNPDNPDQPDQPDPEDLGIGYNGSFYLRSSFNALTLLPHADVEEGKILMFKDMLAGDWIEFTLRFLSNPEKELPSILTEQLLPLLIEADWLQSLIEKAFPSMAGMITPEFVATLVKSLGLETVITNLLEELTGNLPWWDTATSVVKIVNDIATNFTLEGNIVIASTVPTNDVITGVGHSYHSLMYNTGGFETCFIGLDAGEVDADGNKICRIKLSELDPEGSSVKGAFSAKFEGPTKFGSTDVDIYQQVDISRHSLNLAYGRLIYAVLMDSLPMFIKPEDGTVVPSTLGGVLEYYVGLGLLALWNNAESHAENPITGSGCSAVGNYVMALLNEKVSSIGNILETIGGPALITSLCTTGVKSLDTMIENQLDKLSVSSDKVTFSSADCPVNYTMTSDKKTVGLSYFGSEQVWGSSASDKRCTWDMSITTGTDEDGSVKTNTIKGRFWAERTLD